MDITADRDRGIHLQQVGLALEHLCPHLYNPQRLLFGQSTLAIKVLFEELEVGLAAITWRTELIFCGWVESRRLDIWDTKLAKATSLPRLSFQHTFTDPLLRADLGTIFHGMQCEVYLWYRLLVLHGVGGDLEVIPGQATLHFSSSAKKKGSELLLDGLVLANGGVH